ncbi:CUN071 hypothetical protein [Culex nigripalpus nucleopolyhedrovirus]|uniref:Uncharacterized protein n=1 Tax=Culex nigripalpus nucleopolyhedrovirus (isolate Florida/1997) TaxID=645993 RepID=Q919K5_NPVCO|nr:CUN071 hypothetical protein [Culex nigripalpus nucleopolyhedrovirus]AAK94149.1 CUN071 hypothetical protein [Culex nigripalpus nucleopolyhedrovirus]
MKNLRKLTPIAGQTFITSFFKAGPNRAQPPPPPPLLPLHVPSFIEIDDMLDGADSCYEIPRELEMLVWLRLGLPLKISRKLLKRKRKPTFKKLCAALTLYRSTTASTTSTKDKGYIGNKKS